MNSPQQKSVAVFAVVAPGQDPQAVAPMVAPNLQLLGWKFGEMSVEDLIDRSKQVDEYIKSLDKWVEMAKGVLKQKLPQPANPGEETVTRGTLYEAHYIKSSRADIDRDKVKAYFGEKYPQYCKTTEILTLKITAVTQTPGVAS